MQFILFLLVFIFTALYGIVFMLNLHRKCILELRVYIVNLEKAIVKVAEKVGLTAKDL